MFFLCPASTSEETTVFWCHNTVSLLLLSLNLLCHQLHMCHYHWAEMLDNCLPCACEGEEENPFLEITQLNLKMPPHSIAAMAPPFSDSFLRGPAMSLWEELHGNNFIFLAQATFEHWNTGKSLSNWSGTLFVLGERKKLRFPPTINFLDSLPSFSVISFSFLWGKLQWKMFQLRVCCHCKTI